MPNRKLAKYRAKRDFSGTTEPRHVEHCATPGDAVLESACRMNLEGIISKRPNAP